MRTVLFGVGVLLLAWDGFWAWAYSQSDPFPWTHVSMYGLPAVMAFGLTLALGVGSVAAGVVLARRMTA